MALASPRTLQLLHGETNYEAAVEEEDNMLIRLSYWQQKFRFSLYLFEQEDEIEAIVSRHLGLGEDECLYGFPNRTK